MTINTSAPLVSVIIPTYNSRQFVCQAIDSVLAQTIKDYEIIVVDDGSTDDTRQVLENQYCGRIQYVYQENKERSAARNRGISLARGDYVAFLDADDSWLPKKLEAQLRLAKLAPQLGLIYGYANVVTDAGVVVWTMGNYSFESDVLDGDLFEWFILCHSVPTPTVMVKRKCFETVGYFDENVTYCEDWDMWMRVAAKYPVGHVSKVVANYRVYHKFIPALYDKYDFQAKSKYVIEKALQVRPIANAALRAKAKAKVCWLAAFTDFGVGDVASAQVRIAKAFDDGVMSGMSDQEVLDELVGFSTHLYDDITPVGEALSFAATVLSNLPEDLRNLQRQRHWVESQLLSHFAFAERKRGEAANAKSLMRRAVARHPPALFNVGVLTTVLSGTWLDSHKKSMQTKDSEYGRKNQES